MTTDVNANLLDEPIDSIDYQELYGKMLDMMKVMNTIITSAQSMLDSVTEHNTSGTAHPDLRDLFNDDIVDTPMLNDAIASHDRDPESHQGLRERLEAMIADTSRIEALIAEAVYAHNENNSTTHMGMRTQLASIFSQIGNTDFDKVLSDITQLQSDVGAHLQARLLQIENTNVLQDRKDDDLTTELALLQDQMEQLDDTVYTLASIGIKSEQVLKGALERYAIERHARLGYSQFHPEGPVMANYHDTLPMYLGINHDADFTIEGVTTERKDTNLVYRLSPGTSKAILSPDGDIPYGSTMRVSTDTTGEEGEIRYIVVDIVDKNNGGIVSRCIPYYVAKPIDVLSVRVDGIPSRVEPDKKYICRVVNDAETGGRFTYTFDALESGMSLGHASDVISTNEQITIQIPDDAERGGTLIGRIHVHDKYNSSYARYIDFEVEVNHVPRVEDLESNVPTLMVPGTSKNVYFHTKTDILDKCSYDLKEIHPYITFSKTEGIAPNELVTLTMSADAVRGDKAVFTLFITDQYDGHTATEIYIDINQLPSAESVSSNIPDKAEGGDILHVQLAGGHDDDGRVVSYTLVCSDGLTPSKTHDIQDYDDIYISVGKVSEITPKHIDVYCKDNIGELSGEPKRYTIEVSPTYRLTTPQIVNINNGDELEVEFSVHITDMVFELDGPDINAITGE